MGLPPPYRKFTRYFAVDEITKFFNKLNFPETTVQISKLLLQLRKISPSSGHIAEREISLSGYPGGWHVWLYSNHHTFYFENKCMYYQFSLNESRNSSFIKLLLHIHHQNHHTLYFENKCMYHQFSLNESLNSSFIKLLLQIHQRRNQQSECPWGLAYWTIAMISLPTEQ